MPYTNTLATIKQDALRGYKVRGFVTGTVPSFSTTIIQDTARLEPQGEWDRVDSWIKFTSGAANGSEARVMGFSATTGFITFSPSVPSLSITTTYQLTKTFSDADTELAVNSALRDIAPERLVQSFATANEVGDQQYLSVPSAAGNAISRIVRVDRSWGTTNSSFDYRELREGLDYDTDIVNDARTLRLNYPAVSGNIVRFHYRRPAAELSADTDATDEPMSLILAGTKKWLAIQEGDKQMIEVYGREFERAKSDYAKSLPPQTLNVPWIRVRPR